MSRGRKTVAVLCIALVVFAAFLPGGVPAIVWAPLVALWIVVPAVDVSGIVIYLGTARLLSEDSLHGDPDWFRWRTRLDRGTSPP